MKVGLAVNKVTSDIKSNEQEIIKLANEAADACVEFVLFPEMATTGLLTNHEPEHDFTLATSTNDAFVDELKKLCKQRLIFLGISILEKDENQLFDTALLITPEGEIGLKYRRMQPNWHDLNADPNVYRQGTELNKIETSLGSIMFLICGDLWDDEIVQQASELNADYLLFPFARAFESGEWDQKKWDDEEVEDYAERVKRVGSTALMTNCLYEKDLGGWSAGCFGGAWVVSPSGTVLESFPVERSGILVVELK
jgi:predicted amidohydrolase